MAEILLVKTSDTEIVGVRFPSERDAREWEAANSTILTGQGLCLRLVSRHEALLLTATCGERCTCDDCVPY
jgi:hypothetical protein